MNPESQFGSGIFVVLIISLFTGEMLLHSDLIVSERPKLIEALRFIICCN